MKRGDQTASFYDLRDALTQPGCVVCRLKADSVDRFLDSLLWESVNDPDKRQDIRQARGFCREHAWRLSRAGASLGVAIIMRDVLQNVLRTMETATFQALSWCIGKAKRSEPRPRGDGSTESRRSAPEPSPQAFGRVTPRAQAEGTGAASEARFSWSLRRVREALHPGRKTAATAILVSQLEPQITCPACAWVEKMEGIYLEVLVSNLLGEEGLLAAYESSDGLCLPHFRQALAWVRDERVFEALVNVQRVVWERLVSNLTEFICKSDYRFQDEPWGEERDAWLRAIAALTGAPFDWDD